MKTDESLLVERSCKFRLFGKRRSDKARLVLIVNTIVAVLMVVLGYVLYS